MYTLPKERGTETGRWLEVDLKLSWHNWKVSLRLLQFNTSPHLHFTDEEMGTWTLKRVPVVLKITHMQFCPLFLYFLIRCESTTVFWVNWEITTKM